MYVVIMSFLVSWDQLLLSSDSGTDEHEQDNTEHATDEVLTSVNNEIVPVVIVVNMRTLVTTVIHLTANMLKHLPL